MGQLRQRLDGQPVKFVLLATEHPGIPDIEILDKLFGCTFRAADAGPGAAQPRHRLRLPVFVHYAGIRPDRPPSCACISAGQNTFLSPEAPCGTATSINGAPRAGYVGGYRLKVDARHGAKSLFLASESDAPSGRLATRAPEISTQSQCPILLEEVAPTSKGNWGTEIGASALRKDLLLGKSKHNHTAVSRTHAWKNFTRFVSSVDALTVIVVNCC